MFAEHTRHSSFEMKAAADPLRFAADSIPVESIVKAA